MILHFRAIEVGRGFWNYCDKMDRGSHDYLQIYLINQVQVHLPESGEIVDNIGIKETQIHVENDVHKHKEI